MNDGNRQEYHGNISVGLLSARANLEGPIVKDRSSFNVSVRRTWLDLITGTALAVVNKNSSIKDVFGYHSSILMRNSTTLSRIGAVPI